MRIERTRRRRGVRRAAARALLGAALVLPHGAGAQNGIYGYTAADGTLQLTNVPTDSRYRLMLRDPESYRLKDDAAYRLAARAAAGGRPAGEQAPQAPGGDALEGLPYHAEVSAAAEAHGVDPALVHAVIRAESAYRPAAVSHKGAIGLMQLMPDTARRFGVRDPRNPRQNIEGGVRYLSLLLQLFGNDLALAIAAYNAGENAVMKHGNRVPPYAETVQYVPRVLDLYRRFTRTDG